MGIVFVLGSVERPRQARAESADVPKGWVRLATRTVDWGGDHDIIEVGGDGKFTTIRFSVDEGDVVMDHIKVTFRNGEVFEPNTRPEFREGTRSRDIDLPGQARYIRTVEFYYHAANRRGKGVVNLFGRLK